MHVRVILKDTISRAVSCFGLPTFVDRLLADRDEIDLVYQTQPSLSRL